ncbi:MAG: MoxR family ATPase [Acidobacteriota bacterium]|nr:MoxR family ATPase [Acidobacteriota bacterium]MDE3266334.1 MoxR family ATPase [Acidobacteriota bacterium]
MTVSPSFQRSNAGAERGFPDVDAVVAALRAEDYIAERDLATAIYLSLSMGKPIFLEGEPGVGKTEVAKALSRCLGSELIRLQCYEGLDVSTAVYEWNYRRQLLHLRGLEAAGGGDARAAVDDVFSSDFLLERPLLRAVRQSRRGEAPPVLLIDELDRADEEFEAYLLEILADFQITIPEIGTVAAETPPVAVVTSNRTREVHDALKRRCLYHWIDFPDYEKEVQIVLRRVPEAPEHFAAEIVRLVQALREEDLFKQPGVAETLDWTNALIALDQETLSDDILRDTLGVLLKYQDDLDKIDDEAVRRLLRKSQSPGD